MKRTHSDFKTLMRLDYAPNYGFNNRKGKGKPTTEEIWADAIKEHLADGWLVVGYGSWDTVSDSVALVKETWTD